MSDIFHEVEEDLRRDKLNQLWKRYGTLFLTVAVLAVAATAGIVFWRQHEANQREAAANAFNAAGDMGLNQNTDGALAAFGAIAAEGGEGYPVLALFREAVLHVAKSDIQGALATYDKIGASAADPRLKALARLKAAYLVADIETPAVLKNRVADLAGDDSPWRFQAREIQAFADFRSGAMAEAAAAYGGIAADPAAPAGLKARAGKMAAYISGGGTPVAPPKPPAAPAVPAPAVPGAAAPPAGTAPPAEAQAGAPPAADPAPKPAEGRDR